MSCDCQNCECEPKLRQRKNIKSEDNASEKETDDIPQHEPSSIKSHHIGNVVQMMQPLAVTCPISAFFVYCFKDRHVEKPTTNTVTVGVVVLFALCLSAVSFALLYLVKQRKYNILRKLILFATTFVSFYTMMIFLWEVVQTWNLEQYVGAPFRAYISVNYAVSSSLVTFRGGPLILNQMCSLSKSMLAAILATLTLNLPILWGILLVVPLWDLFAVLSPNGPLHQLLNEGLDSGLEDEMGPAVSYASGPITQKVSKQTEEDSGDLQSMIEDLIVDDGVQLGLGDVIVLNVVVCLAVKSGQSLFTVIATYMAVLTGMGISAFISVLNDGNPMPAIPCSALLGLSTLFILTHSPYMHVYNTVFMI